MIVYVHCSNHRAMAKLLKEAKRVKKVLSANNEHMAQVSEFDMKLTFWICYILLSYRSINNLHTSSVDKVMDICDPPGKKESVVHYFQNSDLHTFIKFPFSQCQRCMTC